MIGLIGAFALALQTTPPASAWTWTLYADDAPVVLANEVPDTPNLRTTMECDPGSSVARLTLYQAEGLAGMGRIASGEARAVTQVETGRGGASRLALRTDHPVFTAFATSGELAISVGEARQTIEIPAAHLAKLRRFVDLCSG